MFDLDSSLPKILAPLSLVVLYLIIFWISKWAANKLTSYDINDEISDKHNKAVSIALSRYLIAVSIIFAIAKPYVISCEYPKIISPNTPHNQCQLDLRYFNILTAVCPTASPLVGVCSLKQLPVSDSLRRQTLHPNNQAKFTTDQECRSVSIHFYGSLQ